MNKINTWVNLLRQNPRTLFFMDATGASFSAALLIGCNYLWGLFIGLPEYVIILLMSLAMLFASYSWSCFFWLKNHWRRYIMAIVSANIVYCGLTMGVIFVFYTVISKWAILYFLIEILVIIFLLSIEIKTAQRIDH